MHRELHVRLNMHTAATKMTELANRIPPPVQVVGYVTATKGVKKVCSQNNLEIVKL